MFNISSGLFNFSDQIEVLKQCKLLSLRLFHRFSAFALEVFNHNNAKSLSSRLGPRREGFRHHLFQTQFLSLLDEKSFSNLAPKIMDKVSCARNTHIPGVDSKPSSTSSKIYSFPTSINLINKIVLIFDDFKLFLFSDLDMSGLVSSFLLLFSYVKQGLYQNNSYMLHIIQFF